MIAVCQPTVPVLAAVSLMAARGEPTPRTLIMMGGPIDTRQSPTQVNNLATRSRWLVRDQRASTTVPANYPGRGRRVYPGFLQHAGFIAMNPEPPLRRRTGISTRTCVKGDLDDAEAHRRFYDEYNAVLDMPAEYYLDTVRIVFQEHLLPRGLWEVARRARRRRRRSRDTALMTIEGELDDISGLGQTRAAHELCTGIAEPTASAPDRQGRRPLRHLQRPPLAQSSIRRCATSSTRPKSRRRPAPAPQRLAPAGSPCGGRAPRIEGGRGRRGLRLRGRRRIEHVERMPASIIIGARSRLRGLFASTQARAIAGPIFGHSLSSISARRCSLVSRK